MKELSKEAVRGAIQAEWRFRGKTGMTLKGIADKYGISIPTVQKWKERSSPISKKERKRKGKLSQPIRRYIYKLAVDKFTGNDNASSRKIANRVRKKFNLSVSHVTINK